MAQNRTTTSTMQKRLVQICCLLLLAPAATAQNAPAWRKKASDHLAAQQYQPALEAFQQAEKFALPDAETLTSIGICHYHLHQPTLAEVRLLAAQQAKGTPPPTNNLYLAKLHQARLEFEKAADFFKEYLKKTPKKDPWRAAVRDELRRCATGLRVRRQPPFAAGVLTLHGLNSPNDERSPLPSPTGQERLYFSANGVGLTAFDVFFSEVKNGDWSGPSPISPFVNSTAHEIALGFGQDGSLLYFFRGKTLGSGDILVDTFHENPLERTLFFEAFSGHLRTATGDCAPHFFNDSILLFASARPGGLGGLDLYVSSFTDGAWSPAQNLGPTINSDYDDTSPFLARDGRSLYFSTNDPARSMGGLDVQSATFLDWSMEWSQPQNLGPPINSSADDEGFRLALAGDRAFFSSSRITGQGGHDLYLALFDEQREEQLGESSPVAFHLVAPDASASEWAAQPPGIFFEEINSFELPVMLLPPLGGTPNEYTVNQFALLAQLLKKYPSLPVTVAIHADPADPLAPFWGFASRTVTDLLRQEGVVPGRATLLFAGGSFSFAQGASVLSRRAEVFIENPALSPFDMYRPPLPKEAYRAQFFQKTMTSLAYRVTVNGGDLENLFKLYPEGLAELRVGENGAWKLAFTPGLYLTHASAAEWLDVLVKDGYKEAKITAHLRGRELSKEEAEKYVEDFPDLQYFVR